MVWPLLGRKRGDTRYAERFVCGSVKTSSRYFQGHYFLCECRSCSYRGIVSDLRVKGCVFFRATRQPVSGTSQNSPVWCILRPPPRPARTPYISCQSRTLFAPENTSSQTRGKTRQPSTDLHELGRKVSLFLVRDYQTLARYTEHNERFRFLHDRLRFFLSLAL